MIGIAKKTKRFTLALVAAAFCFGITGAVVSPAYAGDVAFVDVVKVISDSAPGKEGQKIVDDLRAKLNAEFEQYAKTEKDQQKVRARQVALNQQYQKEHVRVSNLVAERLRKVTENWLKSNKKGYTAVVTKDHVLAVNAKDEVTSEITKLLSKEKINFTAAK